MQIRFCVDNAVRGRLFRAGQEFPDVIEAGVPLADLDPDTRSYLWELSGEGMHRPLTLRVPQWDAEISRRREVAWGVPLVPTSAPEWKELLMAYRAAVQAAEEATATAEAAAWRDLVRRAWRWVWLAPVIIAGIVFVAMYTLFPFPSVFVDHEGALVRSMGVAFAVMLTIIFSTIWFQAVPVLWEDRRRRQQQEVGHPKVTA